MRNLRRLLSITALAVLMALCYVWLNITLGEPSQTSSSLVDQESGPNDPLVRACPSLGGDQASSRRTAETIVDFSPADGGTTARIRQTLTTADTDPLADCARRTDLAPIYLVSRLIGDVSISNETRHVGSESEIAGPLINVPVAGGKAAITFITEERYESTDSVLYFSQFATAAPNRITVNGNHLMITSIRGAAPPILRQTFNSVEFSELRGDQQFEISLTAYPSPTRQMPSSVPEPEPTPNSSNRTITGIQEYLVLGVAMLLPWVIVVFLGRRSADPLRLTMRRILGWLVMAVVAVGIPIALSDIALTAGWAGGEIAYPAYQLGLLVLLIVLPMSLLRWRRSLTRRVVLTDAATLLAALFLAMAALHPSAWGLLATVLAGAAGAGLFALLDRPRRSWLVGLSFGLVCAAGVVLLRVLRESSMPYALWVLVLAGWMELVYRWPAKPRWLGWAAAVALGLSLMPLSMLLSDWMALFEKLEYASIVSLKDLFFYLWLLGNLSLGIAAVVVFRRRGAEPAIIADPLYRGLACAAVLGILVSRFSGTFWVLASAVVVIGFGWLLRAETPANTVRLAGVSSAVHARLVRLEGHRQALVDMAKAHFRAAGSAIVSGDKGIRDAARTQSVLDSAAGLSRPPDPSAVRLPRAALGSGAGATPWRNGLVGALCATLLSAPFVVLYEALPTLAGVPIGSLTPTAFWLGYLAWWGRWALYGFLFGYFYPAVRGSTPMRKAGLLLVVLLPLELLALDFALPWSDVLVKVGIRAGHVVVFCLGLGLIWERRLVRAAGFNWGRVRNFGKIRSLVLPATTVLVATVTALVTALAGAAVAPSPEPPQIGNPTSTTAPPGRP